jgi:tRNA pseudouridine55 synthase
MTSTQAVAKVRWLFGAEKAGHAGTLDPLATGVLPIALGQATKTVPYVQDGAKRYNFTVRWGERTTTDDAEGEIVARSDRRPDADAIRAVLPVFTGEISQRPPPFSALKIGGERAYDLARAGEAVELAERPVRIDALLLVGTTPDTARFEVACGKGTYVRALARDLGWALGTEGHVIALHRAAVGRFSDGDAVTLAALEAAELADRDRLLLPLATAFGNLPEIRLDEAQLALIGNGNPVLLTGAAAPAALPEVWASYRGEAVALGVVERGHFQPRRLLR